MDIDLFQNLITDISALSSLVNLTVLDLGNNPDFSGNAITDLTPLANLTQLTNLNIDCNFSFTDISALEFLTNLSELYLEYNSITDITSLVNNAGLGAGDVVYLSGNSLSEQGCADVYLLMTWEVYVSSDCAF